MRAVGVGIVAVLVLAIFGLLYWFGFRERLIRTSEELIKPLPRNAEIIYRTEEANPAGQEEQRNLHLVITSKMGNTTAEELQRLFEDHLRSKGWRLQKAASTAFALTGQKEGADAVLFLGPLEKYLSATRSEADYLSERSVAQRIEKAKPNDRRPLLLIVLEPE